jgi:paraquat-inducible protein B
METQANTRVGLFVIGALVVAIAAVVVLGSARLFHKAHPFILVFRGDINGLRVGAPVKIKGVTIGSVVDIQLQLNVGLESVASRGGGIKIPVLIEIDERRITRVAHASTIDMDQDVRRAIQQGLRAQLAMESFLTGILYIDLDMRPGAPENFEMPRNSIPQEIPTLKTALEQVQSTAAKLMSQLDKVRLDQLFATTQQTLTEIGDLARSPDLKSAIGSLNQTETSLRDTAQSIRGLAHHIDNQVGPIAASIENGAHDIDVAVQKAQVDLEHIQAGLAPDAPLIYRTNQALENISAAAHSLRELSDYLQRDPSAVVRGRYYGRQ